MAKIDDKLGKEGLIRAIEQLLLFFKTYRKAVGMIGEGYELSASTL